LGEAGQGLMMMMMMMFQPQPMGLPIAGGVDRCMTR
jgi:hypothetical protein